MWFLGPFYLERDVNGVHAPVGTTTRKLELFTVFVCLFCHSSSNTTTNTTKNTNTTIFYDDGNNNNNHHHHHYYYYKIPRHHAS